MACCRIVLVFFFFFFCVCVLVATTTTTDAVKGTSAAAAGGGGGGGGGGRWTELTAGSPARYSAGADEFRGSKRRIPKGPDPIHNRRAGKTTVAPRRRD
uniref:Uncharacterized protein n=1 Tax=Oryza barthii TaxID=65489 RepID=A0A0D3G9J1_9ORYZ